MPAPAAPQRVLGRYALFDEIAFGGMAAVHFGRLIGPVGFSRTVAIKRLHSHLARDPEFAAGFVDEGRLAARIRHTNVVPIVEILADDGELSLVMDYVEGDSLAKLLAHAIGVQHDLPLPIVSAIVSGTLLGLHAAHEAKSEHGEPLSIVHRDVSPQNILVGVDGLARIVDFGVAKAAMRLQTTMEGQVKGKVSYMAPEQIKRGEVSRRTDIYAMGVVLWEMLTKRRLFKSENQAHLMSLILEGKFPKASEFRPEITPELDALIARALAHEPADRFATAKSMATELARAVPPAEPNEVGDWLVALNPPGLLSRHELLSRIESLDLEHLGNEDFRAQTATVLSLSRRPPPVTDDVATVIERPEKSSPVSRAPGPDDTTQAVTDYHLTKPVVKATRRSPIPAIIGVALLALAAIGFFAQGSADAGAAFPRIGNLARVPLRALGRVNPATLALQAERSHFLGERMTKNVPAASRETPRTTARPKAECPKFYVDKNGISRVNRKCW